MQKKEAIKKVISNPVKSNKNKKILNFKWLPMVQGVLGKDVFYGYGLLVGALPVCSRDITKMNNFCPSISRPCPAKNVALNQVSSRYKSRQ